MDVNAIVALFRTTITEHYFDLNGRVGRSDFWYFMLACFVVDLAAAIVGALIPFVGAIVSLALLPPITGMGARRLQDVGKSGQLVWLAIIPIAISRVFVLLAVLAYASGPFFFLGWLFFGFIAMLINLAALVAAIVMIYFWVQPGNQGANQFGAEPKAAIA